MFNTFPIIGSISVSFLKVFKQNFENMFEEKSIKFLEEAPLLSLVNAINREMNNQSNKSRVPNFGETKRVERTSQKPKAK